MDCHYILLNKRKRKEKHRMSYLLIYGITYVGCVIIALFEYNTITEHLKDILVKEKVYCTISYHFIEIRRFRSFLKMNENIDNSSAQILHKLDG